MSGNTGRKIYNTLVEIDANTGVATGNTKPNTVGDPDYVPPVVDTTTCPTIPDVIPAIDRVKINFNNKSSQFLNLTNFLVLPQNQVLPIVEYYNAAYTASPGALKVGTLVEQKDDLFKLSFTAFAFSLHIPIRVTIKYITDSGTTTVKQFDIHEGDAVTQINISSPRLSGVHDNIIEISFTDNPPAPNILPVANAGIDQVKTLPTNTAILNGNLSTDSDGFLVGYEWTKVSGPTFTIVNPNAVQAQLSNLVAGVYVFQLKVTDNRGGTAVDTMTITVNPDPTPLPDAAILILVDANNGGGSQITQVNITNVLTGVATDKLTTPVTIAAGSTLKTCPSGRYDVKVTVVLPANSLTVGDNTISTSHNGVYTFNNILIDWSVNGGIIINLSSIASITPLLYAKLLVENSVTTSQPLLPNNRLDQTKADINIRSFSDFAGTTPQPNGLRYRYKVTKTNVLTSTDTVYIKEVVFDNIISVMKVDEEVMYKMFDNTISTTVPVTHFTYAYALLGAYGYLLI